MTKRCLSLLLAGLLCLGLAACGESQPSTQEPSDTLLVGDWTPAGIGIDNTIYSFEELPEIKGSFDGNHMTVSEDGTFFYMNHATFITEGSWTSFQLEGYNHAYALMHETGYRLSFENGELVRVDEGERDGQFKVWLTNEDKDTMVFSDSDSEYFVYYTRDDGDPFYLDTYSFSTSTEPPEESSGTPISPTQKTKEPTSPQPSKETVTMGMRNALATAHDYLDSTAFSYSGLIDQLEYEGYTYAEAVYAVDNCGADWYEQAALMAAEYLDTMSFSRTGLIDQLEYEGFSYDQAVYGVEQAGY